MKTVLELAKILNDVHHLALRPFYNSENQNSPWNDLEFKSENSMNISQEFFLNMAEYIFDIINKTDNKIDTLAENLFKIHSHSLTPFYFSEEEFNNFRLDPDDFWYNYDWENLPQINTEKEEISKDFFIQISKYILTKLKI